MRPAGSLSLTPPGQLLRMGCSTFLGCFFLHFLIRYRFRILLFREAVNDLIFFDESELFSGNLFHIFGVCSETLNFVKKGLVLLYQLFDPLFAGLAFFANTIEVNESVLAKAEPHDHRAEDAEKSERDSDEFSFARTQLNRLQ